MNSFSLERPSVYDTACIFKDMLTPKDGVILLKKTVYTSVSSQACRVDSIEY